MDQPWDDRRRAVRRQIAQDILIIAVTLAYALARLTDAVRRTWRWLVGRGRPV